MSCDSSSFIPAAVSILDSDKLLIWVGDVQPWISQWLVAHHWESATTFTQPEIFGKANYSTAPARLLEWRSSEMSRQHFSCGLDMTGHKNMQSFSNVRVCCFFSSLFFFPVFKSFKFFPNMTWSWLYLVDCGEVRGREKGFAISKLYPTAFNHLLLW